MATAPAPLVAPDVDLTDFAFMPLQIERLRKSKTWLICRRRPELAFYLFNLWMRAWHERPAASIENDDDVLADAAGCPPEKWPSIRDDAMRGWVKCADGRLYHGVMAEYAARMWDAKVRRRARFIRRIEMESGEWDTIRAAVFRRDDFTCGYCGERGGRLECDHIAPLSRGGETEMDNLLTACLSCNRSKGSKTLAEWRPHLRLANG